MIASVTSRRLEVLFSIPPSLPEDEFAQEGGTSRGCMQLGTSSVGRSGVCFACAGRHMAVPSSAGRSLQGPSRPCSEDRIQRTWHAELGSSPDSSVGRELPAVGYDCPPRKSCKTRQETEANFATKLESFPSLGLLIVLSRL